MSIIFLGEAGDCGNATMGITFLLSYLVISFLIIINMYIAVILENYSQATEDVQEGLTDDDYDMYYEIWQQFDPEGTQYLPYNQLSDFLDVLEPPLQIHKPIKNNSIWFLRKTKQAGYLLEFILGFYDHPVIESKMNNNLTSVTPSFLY